MSYQENMMGCDTSEGASYGLLGLMAGISEEYWCASWLTGLELSLWQARNSDEDYHFGQGVVTERQRRLLRDLSEEAGGWWTYGDNGPKFVRLEEWKASLPHD